MSALQVLPAVWATDGNKSGPIEMRVAPITTLAFYRKHTEALLREYMQRSLETGRTPAVLGNFVFRGRVSTYRMHSFEDTVNFVIDIDRCIQRLDKASQELIARIALQEYSYGETASLTGQRLRSVIRRYSDAIDTLTGIFLSHELLKVNPQKSCQ